MKEYKIYGVNNVKVVKSLERAMEYAERESRVGYRVSVFDGKEKIAVFQFGKKNAQLKKIKKIQKSYEKHLTK